MAYFLGGHTITKAGWLGANAVYVDFVSEYTDQLWQLYANRTLIGHTEDFLERRCVGAIVPTDSPAPLTLVRVDPANIRTNYGANLPTMPWNRYGLQWEASGYPADADHFEVTSSTEPGGAVDPDNILANVPYTIDGAYLFDLPPFTTAGVWTFAVTPRDDATPSGTAGSSEEVAITVAVPPPDVQYNSDGTRFTVEITGGVLTASFAF